MADLQRKTANLSSLNEVNDTITNSYFKNNKLTIMPVTAGTYTISFYLAEKTSGILNGSIGIGTLTDYAYDIDNYPTPDNTPYTITRTFTITQSQIDTYGGYIWARFLRYNSRTDFSYKVTQIMLNTGSTAKPYEPYGWQHSLRKLTTATETIQSGDTIYANGQSISTYTIKGNTTQSGTPTPSNPVAVNGVGERTENLTSTNTWKNANTTDTRSYFSARFYVSGGAQAFANVTQIGEYTITLTGLTNETVQFKHNGLTRDMSIFEYTCDFSEPTDLTVSFYANGYNPTELNGIDLTDIMLNTGSTALPYEPYGYFIEIEVS